MSSDREVRLNAVPDWLKKGHVTTVQVAARTDPENRQGMRSAFQYHCRTLGIPQSWSAEEPIRLAMIGVVCGSHDRPCRNEGVVCAHIYPRIGIISHAFSTLPTITLQSFPSFW